MESAIKKQTSVCYTLIWYFKLGIMEKKRKRKAILLIVLAYIADVSCLTNCFFCMRTLSLKASFGRFNPIYAGLREIHTATISVVSYNYH